MIFSIKTNNDNYMITKSNVEEINQLLEDKKIIFERVPYAPHKTFYASIDAELTPEQKEMIKEANTLLSKEKLVFVDSVAFVPIE